MAIDTVDAVVAGTIDAHKLSFTSMAEEPANNYTFIRGLMHSECMGEIATAEGKILLVRPHTLAAHQSGRNTISGHTTPTIPIQRKEFSDKISFHDLWPACCE